MPDVLIVQGGWDGHHPQATSDLIAERLRAHGHEVEITGDLAALGDAGRLAQCRCVVPNWTMGELPSESSAALAKAVASGVGLAGWHGGMGDAFRLNTEFQFLVGGQFVAHPGDILDYTVEITDREHPITRALPASFTVHSEQYYMHVDPAVRVLAETPVVGGPCLWLAGVRMPAAWTREWSKGRVFYCSIGHVPEDLAAEPVGELVTRGIRWAAGLLEDAQ